MSSKQTRNARDDNERGTNSPDDDGAGITEHLINRDTTTDPLSRQVPVPGDPSNNGGVSSEAEDNNSPGSVPSADPSTSRGGVTQNAGTSPN